MARVKFECDGDIDQDTIDELLELAAQKQMSCKYETRKAVLAKLESGAAESERDAVRQVAEETGQTEETVRSRNKRAKKEELGSKTQNEPTPEPKRPQKRKEETSEPEVLLPERYGNSSLEKTVAETALKALKRELAKKFHPDAGGSEAAQQVVNYLLDKFETQFIINPERFKGTYKQINWEDN
jgi:hypothetical protein